MPVDEAQIGRHMRFSVALAVVAAIYAYASPVLLRYEAREAGHPLSLARAVIVWAFPCIFALASALGFRVVRQLRRGEELGLSRFVPLAVALVGIVAAMTAARIVQ